MKPLVSLGLVLALIGCSSDQTIDGIVFDDTHINSDSLKREVRAVLAQDEQAWTRLIHLDCGGASGCYDLGAVLTQLVFRVGEAKVVPIAQKMKRADKEMMDFLLEAGLEYGDHDQDGKMDDLRLESTFPLLKQALKP